MQIDTQQLESIQSSSSIHPQPQIPIPSLSNDLLKDLLDPSMSAFTMCDIHNLSLFQLVDPSPTNSKTNPIPSAKPPPKSSQLLLWWNGLRARRPHLAGCHGLTVPGKPWLLAFPGLPRSATHKA